MSFVVANLTHRPPVWVRGAGVKDIGGELGGQMSDTEEWYDHGPPHPYDLQLLPRRIHIHAYTHPHPLYFSISPSLTRTHFCAPCATQGARGCHRIRRRTTMSVQSACITSPRCSEGCPSPLRRRRSTTRRIFSAFTRPWGLGDVRAWCVRYSYCKYYVRTSLVSGSLAASTPEHKKGVCVCVCPSRCVHVLKVITSWQWLKAAIVK